MEFFVILLPVAITLHALAAVVWVGGMFFALLVLRPALMDHQPPTRLRVWGQVFERFFAWVWLSILLLVLTGCMMVFVRFNGFNDAPLYIGFMHIVGWVMFVLYGFLYFGPYKKFKVELAAENWPGAAPHLALIRRIVGANLGLGLLVVATAVSGEFWT